MLPFIRWLLGLLCAACVFSLGFYTWLNAEFLTKELFSVSIPAIYAQHLRPYERWLTRVVHSNGRRSPLGDLDLENRTGWDKFLIFECVSGRGRCGGLADRQKGIVTAFLLANLTNRRFGIRMNTPCELDGFMVPNEHNWTIPDSEIQGLTTRHIAAIDHSRFLVEMPSVDFNAKYPESVVFLRLNMNLVKRINNNPHYQDVMPSWARRPWPEYFRDVWGTLVKPSPVMLRRLKEFLQSVRYFNRTSPLVGVQVRTWKSAHFADVRRKDVLSRLHVLWEFVQPYVDNGSAVFVATDNPEVRERSRAKFGSRHHDADAVLRHIDRQRSDPDICEAFGGAILDQLILSYCDVLVTSWHSAFAKIAAMIRGSNEQLFQFSTEGVLPLDMTDRRFL